MSAIQQLLTDHIDIWTAADTEKKSGRGRSSGNAGSVYGIKKLRELILELAVRGKLVPQDESDEPASELLKRIATEKDKLIAEGKIKKSKPLEPITEEEKLFSLPHGWEWVRLGDVCSYIQRGKGPAYIDNSDFFVISQKCVRWTGLDLSQARFIDPESVTKYEAIRLLCEGDILWNSTGTGTIGRACLVPPLVNKQFLVADSHVTVVRPIGLWSIFLWRWIHSPSVQSQIEGVASGTTNQIELNTSTVISHLFPLPPLAEQHRIVAKVDELMALCDQLENQHNNAAEAHEKLVAHLLDTLTQSQNAEDFNANWQRIAEHFDTLFTTESSIDGLKQTLLQLAVMGKLVPQDPNDEPASELLKRIQAEKAKLIAEGKIKKDKPLAEISEEEKPFNLPVGWEWVRLGNALLKITDGTHHSPINLSTGSFKYISAKNIKSWGIDLDNVTYVTEDVHEEIYSRCNPEYGDVLYIKDGATTGITTINTLKEPFSMLSSVALLKPSVDIYNEYLLKAITAPFFYAEIRAEMTGVAITRVTLSKLNNALIPISSLTSQKRILIKPRIQL